jgi:hypothetical protein
MDDPQKVPHSPLRVLALALALLSVVFLVQSLTHFHTTGQDEAACQICQAAHIGPAPAARVELQVSALLVAGYVQPFVAKIHQELFSHDCPSRAPPTV